MAALAVAFSARPLAAAPRFEADTVAATEVTRPIPTRFEGQVKTISGKDWVVDQTPVVRGPKTVVIEKRGAAVPGAWVLVAGLQYPNRLEADTIEVQRPASADPPTYQITGVLRKQYSETWIIEETPIDISPETTYVGRLVLNGLVRATVRLIPNGYEAVEFRALASDIANIPFAIEGTVEQVTDNSWVVDEHTILVPPERGVTADQGDRVEVAALAKGDGSLVAQEARVVDISQEALLDGYVTSVTGLGEDNQTWTLQVFEGGHSQQRTIHVTRETYVDEDRAVIAPNVEAKVQGVKKESSGVDAALVRLEKPVPASVAGELTRAGPDELWHVGSQSVWFESDDLRQAAQDAAMQSAPASRTNAASNDSTSIVVRGVRLRNGVLIAQEVFTGEAAAAAGVVVVPASEAGAMGLTGEDWYGPTGINASLENAYKPTILFDSNGSGHAVYESAGRIFYAYQLPGTNWGPAKKIGTGFKPTAVFDAHGNLHVAYTNEFLGNYDILHVRLTAKGWSLPYVVAPTTGRSDDPVIAADGTGKVYVAWMDFGSDEWAIQLGLWDGSHWTSYPVPNARGQSPALTVFRDGGVFLAWQDRIPLGGNTWGLFDVFASERSEAKKSWSLPVNISDNRTFRPTSNSLGARVTTAEGFAHVAWIDDTVQVRYVFGRESFWPVPVDVTDRRSLARGLSIQSASDNLLYLAWDEGASLRVTASPPRTTSWPPAVGLATRSSPANGRVWDVSLAVGGSGVAVSWVQDNLSGRTGVYESRHNMQPILLKNYLSLVTAQ